MGIRSNGLRVVHWLKPIQHKEQGRTQEDSHAVVQDEQRVNRDLQFLDALLEEKPTRKTNFCKIVETPAHQQMEGTRNGRGTLLTTTTLIYCFNIYFSIIILSSIDTNNLNLNVQS